MGEAGSGLLVVGAGIGSCFAVILALYNAWIFIGFARETHKDRPSTAALAAWALSLLALFLPCGGFFLAVITFFLARYEQGRIYNEESPISSTTPCDIASMNSMVVIVANLLFGLLGLLDLM
jgi:hypothetical protein